ncbi:hypothetical protein [Thalassoglobus polymorphus]|uniref:Uncharacterized protein n=1 Tax=Thalassoglobus polymorphus TaxID=2527994 RepID=A0A517QLJ9_9PLAN|nr:hypothetical protein [Thalassoglobus polymorphus]QDT32503.1 hypothetical protein Mal48_17500 [Thalassoglobus polymorphus]
MSASRTLATLETRRYQAPQQNGEVLAVPDLPTAIQNAKQNAEQLAAEKIEIGSFPLSELRKQARSQVITKAVEWTNSIIGQNLACAECSHHASLLFVTGHQPQLAHPGVWAKNFAAAGMAQSSQGIGLNIIVDNDTVGKQSIRVPDGSRREPKNIDVSFDSELSQQPWEELQIRAPEVFRSFAEHVKKQMSQWGIDPLVSQMWPDAVASSQNNTSMVAALSAARMQQERRCGGGNLEIPLSEICKTDAFLIFVAHLLFNTERFHASYNSNVEAYRRENGIRNDRHPVPNLEQSGDAFEMPFWFWREGDSERGRVFVSRTEETIKLLCRGEVILSATPQKLLAELKSLQVTGKLRTRALTTTLFARLCLADLFVHGIGGAKYDEMTDRLIADFFGIVPPHFLVLSATLHLPVDSFDVTEDEVRELKAKLRDYQFNADRYLTDDLAGSLKTKKNELIREHWNAQTTNLPKRERVKNRFQNRNRHRKLNAVNDSLFELAKPQVDSLKRTLAEKELQLKANSVLRSREYSSVLFPVESINSLASELLEPAQVQA